MFKQYIINSHILRLPNPNLVQSASAIAFYLHFIVHINENVFVACQVIPICCWLSNKSSSKFAFWGHIFIRRSFLSKALLKSEFFLMIQ